MIDIYYDDNSIEFIENKKKKNNILVFYINFDNKYYNVKIINPSGKKNIYHTLNLQNKPSDMIKDFINKNQINSLYYKVPTSNIKISDIIYYIDKCKFNSFVYIYDKDIHELLKNINEWSSLADGLYNISNNKLQGISKLTSIYNYQYIFSYQKNFLEKKIFKDNIHTIISLYAFIKDKKTNIKNIYFSNIKTIYDKEKQNLVDIHGIIEYYSCNYLYKYEDNQKNIKCIWKREEQYIPNELPIPKTG